MAITEFGKFIRKFRLDNDERLYDMAQKLDVSSAFLSSVETGKKSIPQKLLDNLETVYSLSDDLVQQMNEAVSKTVEAAKNTECILNAPRPVMEWFARSTSDLKTDQMKQLQEQIESFLEQIRGTNNHEE